MLTFSEFLEQEKRVVLYGIGKNRKHDTSRVPKRQLGLAFTAVNPAVPVVWDMKAGRIGHKKKKSGVLGKS